MEIDFDKLYDFYRSFRFLFFKLKQGGKLNFYDKVLLDIFDEYNYVLEYSNTWRKWEE